ncbi:MAG TPA: response regulator transcription factor [Chloroflexi bacterium]|nr:response regulator transcription factor [Chloroflexota bacterium]
MMATKTEAPHTGREVPQETRVLVVEDDAMIRQLLSMKLSKDGFQVFAAESGPEALRLAYKHHPAAIILDIMMPGMDGFEVCRRLREMTDAVIIFVTAKGRTEDVITGLQTGADDYLTKPYDYRELAARLVAALRRREADRPSPLLRAAGEFLWLADPARRLVFLDDGTTVQLTPREFAILQFLVRNQGQVMSPDAILAHVWGPEYIGDRHLVKQYIYRLRKKLEPDPSKPRNILTIPSAGYLFEASLGEKRPAG